MENALKFYIDGAWVDPSTGDRLDVINPATNDVLAKVPLSPASEVDEAAKAATESSS